MSPLPTPAWSSLPTRMQWMNWVATVAGTDQMPWTARRSAGAASLWIAGWRGARPHWRASRRDDRDSGPTGARVPHCCKCRTGWARASTLRERQRGQRPPCCTAQCVHARTAQVGLGSVPSSSSWGTPGCTRVGRGSHAWHRPGAAAGHQSPVGRASGRRRCMHAQGAPPVKGGH